MPLTPVQALNSLIEPTIVDLRLSNVRTLANFYARGRMKVQGWSQIKWPVVFQGASVGNYAINAASTANTVDYTLPALLTIGSYRVAHQFSVLRTDLQEAATRGPDDLKDLFRAYVEGGLLQIFRNLNTYIWTGDGTSATAGMIGLNKIADNTYAYAGIDPVANPRWTALVQNNTAAPGTARPLTNTLLTNFNQYVDEQESYYNYVTCHTGVGSQYESVWNTIAGSAQLTYDIGNGSGLDIASREAQFKRVDLGHGLRSYKGIPLVEDALSTQNQIAFLNLDQIDFITFKAGIDPQANLSEPASSDRFAPLTTISSWGLAINVAELPSLISTQKTFEIFVIPQLRLRKRNALMVLQDIKAGA